MRGGNKERTRRTQRMIGRKGRKMGKFGETEKDVRKQGGKKMNEERR